MNSQDFVRTLADAEPPGSLDPPLKALWWDGRGDWSQAHAQVDELETPQAVRVHAYLHRKQGEEANAAYWYRHAGRPIPTCSHSEEWTELVGELLLSAAAQG